MLLGLGLLYAPPLLTKHLDDWQLLPRPERLSELYFTDYPHLAESVTIGLNQKFVFTVHNLEHKTTEYRYKVLAVSSDTGAEEQLSSGAITLTHDESQHLTPTVTIPKLGSKTALKVSLEYDGIAFGSRTPSRQTQSIQYWIKDPHENS